MAESPISPKPSGTFRCYYRPNRKDARTFKAQDVARIYCRALSQGVKPEEIDQRIEKTCPDTRRRPDNAAAEALAMAVAVSQGNIAELNSAYNLFLLLNGILLALLALPLIVRRSPGLFVIFRGISRVQSSVAAQVTVLGRQIAANEALYSKAIIALRRAA